MTDIPLGNSLQGPGPLPTPTAPGIIRPPPLIPATTEDLNQIQRVASLENSFNHVRGQQFDNKRELKSYLQNLFRTSAGNDWPQYQQLNEDNIQNHIVPLGTVDSLRALSDPQASGVGWYGRQLNGMMHLMQMVYPELKTDQGSRLAAKYALAVHSNQTQVDKNFQQMQRAYEYARNNKLRFPTDIGIGQAAPEINQKMGLWNKWLDEGRTTKELERIFRGRFTVGQLQHMMNLPISGEHVGETVNGTAVVGPKIGNGFLSNLLGNFDALTMDRWLTRTWGRWTGDLIRERPDMIAMTANRLAGLWQQMSPEQRQQMELALRKPVDSSDPVALAMHLGRAGVDKSKRDAMDAVGYLGRDPRGRSMGLGSDIRKAANRVVNWTAGETELPSAAQRPWIRRAFGHILTNLHTVGHRLNMSDLQAALWYPEKRLYDSAKMDPGEAQETYGETAQPDFFRAALNWIRGMKDEAGNRRFSERQIAQTLSRIPRAGRPTGFRPEPDEGVAAS